MGVAGCPGITGRIKSVWVAGCYRYRWPDHPGIRIGVWFANEGSGDLAVYLDNQFEGLDRPIVSSAEIESLENHWQIMESEIAGWHICAEEL